MELDPVLLSRIQFAFTISFHIIFPSFTIGLAAWLATMEGVQLATGNPLYRRVFDLWLKVFAVSFGMGVVSGIVMAFEFGTNWSVLSEKTGPIQGPLLGYETFTAFLLEATFLGVVLVGRERVPRWLYFVACCMLALGTMASSFWILANNSWMQVPVGHTIVDGKIIPSDWKAIIAGQVFLIRWAHMLLAAFLSTAMCVIAAGASYMLRGIHRAEALVMMHWGMGLAAVLIVVQLFFGHLNGKYVYEHQPTKFAAIEARWQPQQPGTEVWFAIPDEAKRRNLFAIESPGVGSLIATGTWTAPVYGLSDYPEKDWPPVVIPFFAFRIMVGMGLAMLAISWFGNWLRWRGRLQTTRWFLWCATLAFPAGFMAILSGWFTAEVGRQPWVVWGLLRTVDAVTPTLTGPQVLATLIGYVVVYTVIFVFGMHYIYVLLRDGPAGDDIRLTGASGMRPMAAAGPAETATGSQAVAGEFVMDPTWLPIFWAAVIAFAILVYVVLDGYDLGVGILFGTALNEQHRVTMMKAIAPFWDGNETWLVLIGAGLFAAFPMVYAIFLPAFYLPITLMLFGLIFRGVAFEFRYRSGRMRPVWDWGFFVGSLVATFVQGVAIGTMVQELPVIGERYAGGAFEWVTPFSILCGAGLVLGYALLGAAWLVLKTEGDLRDWAYRRLDWLLGGVIVVLIAVFTFALVTQLRVLDRWLDDPRLVSLQLLGVIAVVGLLVGVRRRRDGVPFAMAILLVTSAFLRLAASFWPYMIPYSITVQQAAAPTQSLEFLFWGAGVIVLPVVLIYTAVVYWIFRGKVGKVAPA